MIWASRLSVINRCNLASRHVLGSNLEKTCQNMFKLRFLTMAQCWHDSHCTCKLAKQMFRIFILAEMDEKDYSKFELSFFH
jgi:hypothetical protein